MTSVLPIEARGTSTCSLGGGKIAKKPIPPSLKPTKLENKVNIDMQPRWILGKVQGGKTLICFGSQRRNRSSNWSSWEDEPDAERILKNSSWWAPGRTAIHEGYPAPHWSDPRSKSTYLLHYQINLKESEVLREKVEELIQKRHIRESMG